MKFIPIGIHSQSPCPVAGYCDTKTDKRFVARERVALRIRRLFRSIVVVITVLAMHSTANADEGDMQLGPHHDFFRESKAEIYGMVQGFFGDTQTFTGGTSTVEFHNTTMGGIGGAYNINDHINVGLEANFGKIDLTMPGPGGSTGTHVTAVTVLGNIEYNIINAPVTPVVVGSLGLMHIGRGIQDGFYISKTGFAYGVGGGVRWDITEHVFLKALYRSLWADFSGLEDTPRFDTFGVYLGLMF